MAISIYISIIFTTFIIIFIITAIILSLTWKGCVIEKEDGSVDGIQIGRECPRDRQPVR